MATPFDAIDTAIESGGDITAQNPKSTASGKHQFLDKTWQSMGMTGRASDYPEAVQDAVWDKYSAQNSAVLRQLGLPQTPSIQYLAAQQGPAGAAALLKDPDKPAVQALIDIGVPRWKAEASIVNNGGTLDMPAGEFTARVQAKVLRAGNMADAGADTSGGGGDLSSVLAQLLKPQPMDAQGQALLDKSQAQSADTAKTLTADQAERERALKAQLAEKSPAGVDMGQFQPPSEAGLEKSELAKVSNRPNDPMRVLGQFLPLLAIVGGSLVKHGAIASLKAATAAMSAARSNDQAAVQEAHKKFTDAMTDVKQRLEEAVEAHNEAREKYGDDMNGYAATMRVIDAKDGNTLGLNMLASGNFDQYYKSIIQPKQIGLEKIAPILMMAQKAQTAKNTVLQDTDGTAYVYNPQTHEATTLDGDPYTPKGAVHLASGQPRSMAAEAMKAYELEHPGATADDLTRFAMQYGAKTAAGKAFATGKQGDTVRSLNVAIAHMDLFEQLAEAEDNGDIQTANKLKNQWQTEFGSPAPANAKAAGALVGDEVIKAVTAGGGALADRENAQNQFSNFQSWKQVQGVVDTYQKLLGGQLGGLRSQYQNSTGETNFNDLLLPETKKALGIPDDESAGGTNMPPPPGDGHALPPASVQAYQKGTPAQKEAAKKAWAKQGFDVSGLG